MTYTVIDRSSGYVIDRHLTASQAASTVLQHDGASYRVVSLDASYDVGDEHQFVIKCKRLNSCEWGQISKVAAYASDADAAWPILAEQVIARCALWREGTDVMSDSSYDQMMAELAADAEE
ncbi:hypothetical protein HLH33_13800 [Gluconacetobacter diazotrophicus]|uniref:Uncharacterized protein n=1 Tax=Gluconacetobacter diazotrophicus TaxID=33996 RepID=A0A7W4I6W1_GLUDI|nr:hypothetical protein [Gluconacetobacter diazotrophicus]MBB2157373.1 hypothetical protein [Gluconacetobacter diazotrophicus]